MLPEIEIIFPAWMYVLSLPEKGSDRQKIAGGQKKIGFADKALGKKILEKGYVCSRQIRICLRGIVKNPIQKRG
jgi:hypothetical protein